MDSVNARVGSMFGRYELRSLLGRGGFGEVYEAQDTEMDRLVALKLLSEPYSHDKVFRERLFREARTAGRLHDPHVVPIHQYGEIDGQLFIDMRLIPGTDLQTVLARETRLSPARAVAVVRQIAAALDAAHNAEMVHRDVKPGNILLTGDDFACLVDFGLAYAASDASLTSAGTTIGTFAYMAPERLNNAQIDHRADIYALACVLFECLTGSQPFRAHDRQGLIAAHLTAPTPRPSERSAGVPAGLDAVIARGMAKDPNDRYGSAGEFARAAYDGLGAEDQSRADTILADTQAASRGGGATLAADQWRPDRALFRTLRAASRPSPAPPSARKPFIRKPIRLAALLATAVVSVIVCGYLISRPTAKTCCAPPVQPAQPPAAAVQPSATTAAPMQAELPFTAGILYAHGLAVDSAGNLYISDGPNMRVGKLAPGQTRPVALGFTGLHHNQGVAVNAKGDVYVADTLNNRILMLPAGSTTQVQLPFNLLQPDSVAADSAGNVYVTTWNQTLERPQLVMLPAGSTTPIELATTLVAPEGVAVDSTGAVYVADKGSGVFKYAAGSATPIEVPFTGLNGPDGIAVDSSGDIYVADYNNNRVVELPVGTTTQLTLPFTGLHHPVNVAADNAGTIYVADIEGDSGVTRVLKLGTAASGPAAAAPPAPTPVPTAPSFEAMREFINDYYGQLPTHTNDTWTKLDLGYQQRVGFDDYQKFWSTVRTVTVTSVSPRDSSSVVAHLHYVFTDGHELSEDRWYRIVVVDGALLIADSEIVH
jgi:serine/threonine protein kinase, bacterial